jgi:MYXO-CTERM domain-containing protein
MVLVGIALSMVISLANARDARADCGLTECTVAMQSPIVTPPLECLELDTSGGPSDCSCRGTVTIANHCTGPIVLSAPLLSSEGSSWLAGAETTRGSDRWTATIEAGATAEVVRFLNGNGRDAWHIDLQDPQNAQHDILAQADVTGFEQTSCSVGRAIGAPASHATWLALALAAVFTRRRRAPR